MTDNSKVTIAKDCVVFEGQDATSLYRALALRSALLTFDKYGIQPNRAWTPTAMLTLAKSFTRKTYYRGEYVRAAKDLTVWIEAMKTALPIVEG